MSFSAKLDHCVIHVSNWERSNEFYQKVLGAELIDDGGRVAYLWRHALACLARDDADAEDIDVESE